MVHLVLGFSFSFACSFSSSLVGALDVDGLEKAARKESDSHPKARCIKKAEPIKSSKTPTNANAGSVLGAELANSSGASKSCKEVNPEVFILDDAQRMQQKAD